MSLASDRNQSRRTTTPNFKLEKSAGNYSTDDPKSFGNCQIKKRKEMVSVESVGHLCPKITCH